MIIQLPLSSDPVQSFTIQLGPTKYDIYVRYNDRSQFWTMDVTDTVSQAKLISGMPLLLGCDLWGPYVFLNNGSLIAYDEQGTSTDAGDPDSNDLGSRVNIYWLSSDEVTAAINGTSD